MRFNESIPPGAQIIVKPPGKSAIGIEASGRVLEWLGFALFIEASLASSVLQASPGINYYYANVGMLYPHTSESCML